MAFEIVSDMTENQYRELLKALGIEARRLGHVLRYAGQPRRLYFNQNRNVGIYFSAHADDEAWYPSNLWEKIGRYQVKGTDHGRLNVIPRSGMATSAFRNLVENWNRRR